jgi:hypothetical protein
MKMSSLPALAVDSSAPRLLDHVRAARLSDAEKVASERLDSASISSLKAALAGVSAQPPLPTAPRLVERIDAAARLAADATAAAEAVERLKRLLQAQLAASRPSSGPAEPIAAVPPAPPMPLPTETPQSVAAPAALLPEPRRPDIGGFLAGFVLSGAIGAVLYLYMMAG